ncbi:unnamed protein product [Caenorhabditis sp. 36 PRJEB53466]|nr:unnamed protein product [Caenorhabditis sp. 36 PRJEB53466]
MSLLLLLLMAFRTCSTLSTSSSSSFSTSTETPSTSPPIATIPTRRKFPNSTERATIYRMMFDASARFRTDNYRKAPLLFEQDWELCDETYRWPKCCLWRDKKTFARGTIDCNHIKGDVLLENDYDANLFQSFLDIIQIQGNLVLRNTTIVAFGVPHLSRIGFNLSDPKKFPAVINVENNPLLAHFRLRRLDEIVKNARQKYGIFSGNPKLHIDSKQYQILKQSSNHSDDFEQFTERPITYKRHESWESYPYWILAAMISIALTHHFVMIEINESRIQKKDIEMISAIRKMRDAVLAAELLLQTPDDTFLSFDSEVLHLCSEQLDLIRQIQGTMDAEQGNQSN